MGIRTGLAQAVSAVSTVALKNVFRRPAANFPGKIALYVDPSIIGNMAHKLRRGSVIVVGTNGKTTTTNLLADALEKSGQSVICNRTGANLDSGVATSLLHGSESDWGIFESDELWMARILPFLQSDYVILLNLFRDQLDRVGEIDKVQDSIVGALESSPKTVLVYNADDPLCTAIADKASNKSIAFGIGEDMGLEQNTVTDAQMCQRCSGMLQYDFRQYGQLGRFHCDTCDFHAHSLQYEARDIDFSGDGLRFCVKSGLVSDTVTAPYKGAYMVYNLLATYVAAVLLGCPVANLQAAINDFNPENGRLQSMRIHGRDVLLNLAKNPTGFNQNMKLVVQGEGRKVAGFFINDKEADGHDISWIWDVDFEELEPEAAQLQVFAGGIRKNDLQMRLKYAGVHAVLAESAAEIMARADELPADYSVYMIANYTALPAVREDLMAMRDQEVAAGESAVAASAGEAVDAEAAGEDNGAVGQESSAGESAETAPAPTATAEIPCAEVDPFDLDRPLRIVHLFPELLNLYGDGGNPRVLLKRCLWRGIPAEVHAVHHGEEADLSQADIVFLGGGPDREQRLASEQLMAMRQDLHAYVEADGPLLAICGGFQILGSEWLLADEVMEGLNLLDVTTKRAPDAGNGAGNRIIDNVVLRSDLATHPVVGYENHAGRTFLGAGVAPFGTVINKAGVGNNDSDGVDGACYRNVIGTYLHGPLLGKNPEIADTLIRHALERRLGTTITLPPLDDSIELAANAYMCKRLGVG